MYCLSIVLYVFIRLILFLESIREHFVVRLGKRNINKKEPEREQEIPSRRLIIHPNYSKDTMDSDVALIQLQKDASYTPYVKPICLPLQNTDSLLTPSTIGVVTGWGYLNEPRKDSYGNWISDNPDILQKVTVPVVRQVTCKLANVAEDAPPVTNNMFCAGFPGGRGDACLGDSGGPLAINIGNEHDSRWVLAGVVSWGIGCGRAGKYGVYTRVSAFSRWITNHTNYDL